MEVGGAGIKSRDVNNFGKGQHDLIDIGMGAGGGAIGAIGGGTMTRDRFNHYGEHIDMEYAGGGTMLGQGNYSQYSGGLFDGMALSSEFLGEYYSNVSAPNVTTNVDREVDLHE